MHDGKQRAPFHVYSSISILNAFSQSVKAYRFNDLSFTMDTWIPRHGALVSMFKYKCRFEALHGSVIVKPVRSLRYRSDQSPLDSCTVKEVIVLV